MPSPSAYINKENAIDQVLRPSVQPFSAFQGIQGLCAEEGQEQKIVMCWREAHEA